MKNEIFYGAIEGGGTKFVCALIDAQGNIRSKATIPTRAPDETLGRCSDFFEDALPVTGVYGGIGIGTFGPLDVDPASPTYGEVFATPKAGWEGTNILELVKASLKVPVAITTDVTSAAIGEAAFGAATDCRSVCYVTVGTGIGGATVIDKSPLLSGRGHPELGHMIVTRHASDHNFRSTCPFHNNCIEGLASGSAIKARWSKDGKALPEGHPAWDLEAYYLASLCVNITYALHPDVIVFGGGVILDNDHLVAKVRREYIAMVNGYLASTHAANISTYIRQATLAGDAGIIGAAHLTASV